MPEKISEVINLLLLLIRIGRKKDRKKFLFQMQKEC